LLVAKNGKPCTIAEELILPAAKIMVSAILGDKTSKELNTVFDLELSKSQKILKNS